MRDQAGENGESQEAKAERRTGEATVRRKREEREERKGRSSRLSSRKRNGSGRKEANGRRKISKGKHLRNGRGSESGKGERKHTAKLSTGTGIESTGNQAGENGEDRGSESESGALRKPL